MLLNSPLGRKGILNQVIGGLTDPDFSNVALGAEFFAGSNSDYFPGSDLQTAHDVTVDTLNSKFGTQSMKLGDSGQSSISFDPSTNIELTNQDFCFEFWLRRDSIPVSTEYFLGRYGGSFGNNRVIFGGYNPSNNSIEFFTRTTTNVNQTARFDTDTDGISEASLFDGSWFHVALVRNGSETSVWVNGVKGSETGDVGANALEDDGSRETLFGSRPTNDISIPGSGWTGNMDEIRVTIGSSRYTSAFTPPSTEFPRDIGGDALFNDVVMIASFEGQSLTSFFSGMTLPDYSFSGYRAFPHVRKDGFTGYDDVLHSLTFIPDLTAYDLASSDFCIELFGCKTPDANETILALWNDSNGDRGWKIDANSGLRFSYSTDGTNVNQITSAVAMGFIETHDYAIDRSGNSLRIFKDGVMTDNISITDTIFNPSGKSLSVGCEFNDTLLESYNANPGELRAFRITKASRYGSNSSYSVPTLPLPKN